MRNLPRRLHSRKQQPRRRMSADRFSRKEITIRVVLILFILAGLVFSIYSMFNKGDVYVSIQEMINSQQFKKVEKLTLKLHESNPLDVRTLRLMGHNYFLQALRIDHIKDDQTEEGWELYKKAVKSLKKAILLDKQGLVDSSDYMIIGFAYMKRGDSSFEEALNYLIIAEKKDRSDKVLTRAKEKFFSLSTLYKLMGYLFFKTGKYERALEYYTRANTRKNVLNYLYIGMCQRQLKQYDEAIKTFVLVHDYSSLRSFKIVSLQNLGWLYYMKGNISRAKMIYKRCVRMDTNSAEDIYWLGKMEQRLGNMQEARRLWKRCLKVDPHFGPAILEMKSKPHRKRS